MNRDASDAPGRPHPDGMATMFFVLLAAYAVLVATGRTTFLPYHAVVEFFVAAVSLSIFFVSWHTRSLVHEDFLTVIGITQLIAGVITVLHLLGNNGMDILSPWNPNAGLGNQFWLILRAVQAVGLVVAPFYIGKCMRHPSVVAGALGLPATAAVYSVFAGVFPATTAAGGGFTPFKIVMETLIVGGMGTAIILLRARGSALPRRTKADLQLAIGAMILAELLFMMDRSPFDAVSVIGHVVHVASIYFMYRALIARRLEDPFTTLFHKVRESEQIVRIAVERVRDGVTMLDPTTGRYLLVNPMAAQLSGFTPEEFQSLSLPEIDARVHPDDLEVVSRFNDIAKGAEGPSMLEYRWKVKSGEYRWFRHYVDPAMGPDEMPIGVVSTYRDITEDKRAQEHHALLGDISRDFADCGDPHELLTAVSHRVAEHLDAEVVYFLEVDEARDEAALGGYRIGEGPLPKGECISLSEVVTPAFRVRAHAHETVVIEDAEGDPHVSRTAIDVYDLGSAICVPLHQDGEWRFLFAVANSHPRQWRADEIEVTETVASRLYWRVQRARAEIGLRERAARQKFLLRLADSLEGLGPVDVQARSVSLLADYLRCSTALYAEFDQAESAFCPDVVAIDQSNGPTMSMTQLPSLAALLRSEGSVSIADTLRADVLTDAERSHLASSGVRALACAPLVRDGHLLAALVAADGEPRDWSGFETGLLEETAERVWSSLIAARATDQLHRSLERTRLLQVLASVAASSLDSRELSRRTLDIARERLGADKGVVYLIGSKAGLASAAARFGDEDGQASDEEVAIDDQTPCGRAIRTGRVQASGTPPSGIDADGSAEMPGCEGHRFVCVPIVIRTEVIGLIALAFPEARPFESQEMELYSAVANQLGVGLENARLYEVEHGIAETLQETLVVLPTQVSGIRFSRAYESATYQRGRVGGDFIDVFEARGNLVGLTLGDVSGKGIDAAVTTSLVRNTLRVHAADGLPPALVAAKANLLIRRFTETESFVTLWFGLLNTKTGLLRYVSAGHPPAFVIPEEGEIVELRSTDPILGVLDEARFFEHQAVLDTGDRLLLYSDGITEARSPEGAFLGEDGLRALIERYRDEPAETLSAAIMNDLISLSEGVLRDDAALLAVEPSRIQARAPQNVQLQAFTIE